MVIELTYQPVRADTAGNDNDETEREDDIQRNLLSPRDGIMPGNDARKRDCVHLQQISTVSQT